MLARYSFSLVALLGSLVFIAGCGQKLPADLPQLHPTQIEVSAGGDRLEKATVTLHPVGSTEPVAGITNAKGIAEIRARGQYSGAPVGKYKVTVYWTIQLEGPTASKPVPTDPAELERYKERVVRERVHKPALEPQFGDPLRTPLTVEVVEGKNNFTLEVKKLDPPPTR